MSLSAEQIEKLKAEHGSIHELTHEESSVVVKRPNRNVYRRWKTQSMDEAKRPIAIEQLLLACVVHPPQAELEAMLDERPGLVETFGSALLELAGLARDVEKKAL